LKKIAIIGPSSEKYKGGIAHFSTCLADTLEEKSEVLFISWSVLYPPFISKRNFLDETSKLRVGNSKAVFILSYVNPLSWIRTVFRLRKFRGDKVVFSWVHPVHGPVYITLLILLRFFTRSELVMQCHNVQPHESFPGAKTLSSLVFRLAHTLTVHSASEKKNLMELVPGKRILQLFHPVYEFPVDTDSATTKASCVNYQLLFFGIIREYKGLDLLLAAVKQLIEHQPHLKLTIAGECFDEKNNNALKNQVMEAGLNEIVDLDLRYIPNEEVSKYFNRADLVVLPYRSATSSGPLTLAYYFKKPVVATNVGGLSDYVSEGKSGYLCEANADSIAQTILKAIDNPIKERDIEQHALLFSWDQYAEKLLNS
jgi:glycosyltransferase involved in cell wall biosynthesis